MGILSVICSLSSCSYDDNISYTIDYQMDLSILQSWYPGCTVTSQILVREYNDLSECVENRDLGYFIKGQKTKVSANKHAKKVTVGIVHSIYYHGDVISGCYWLSQIYMLDKKSPNNIYIDGHVYVTDTEPIK